MYKIEIINCQRILKERFGRPIVYLDHWALNDLSLNAGYKKRFVNVMNEQGGTLRLSSCNIEELINQGDTRQIDAIFEMIESIDCGFIDINFKEVIERENYLIKNPSVIENPSINLGLIHDYLMSKNWPLEWRLVDMISTVVKETSIQKQRTRGSAFADKMNWLIDFARNNHDCLKKVSKRVHQTKSEGQRYSAATRELVLMMYDLIIKNKKMKMPDTEWIDLFHLIVPVAYCDIVLIDKRWKTFVAQTGLKYPQIAKVFDCKSIDNFFNELDGDYDKNSIE